MSDEKEAVDSAWNIIREHQSRTEAEQRLLREVEELAIISERLKALGYKEVRLKKYPFDPNIPDPDLQMHATLEIIGENLSDENLITGAEVVITDLARYATSRFGKGLSLMVEGPIPPSDDHGAAAYILLNDRKAFVSLAELAYSRPSGLKLTFPRHPIYLRDVEKARSVQSFFHGAVDNLGSYCAERLHTLPMKGE